MVRTTKLSFLLLFLFSVCPLSYAEPMSPETVNGATTITAEQAKDLFESGANFVDVRKNSDWDAGRIPGALHIELKKDFTENELAKELHKDQPIVLYCNGPKCMRSSQASQKAVSWGYQRIYYFREGFPAWKEADFPVE